MPLVKPVTTTGLAVAVALTRRLPATQIAV
jgi:hypothetical protein